MNSKNSLNGVEVTDLETLAESLSYLQKEYNDGEMWFAEGGELLCIKGRSRILENHITRLVQNVSEIRFTTIAVRDGNPYVEVRNSDE